MTILKKKTPQKIQNYIKSNNDLVKKKLSHEEKQKKGLFLVKNNKEKNMKLNKLHQKKIVKEEKLLSQNFL